MSIQAKEAAPPAAPKEITSIARSVTVLGSVCGRGSLRVEGTVMGKVRVDGELTVGTCGRVRGPVEAGAVQISGCVEGDIVSRSQIRLGRLGSIDGDVTARSLVVEDGGRLNGRSTMLQDSQRDPEFDALFRR